MVLVYYQLCEKDVRAQKVYISFERNKNNKIIRIIIIIHRVEIVRRIFIRDISNENSTNFLSYFRSSTYVSLQLYSIDALFSQCE